MTNFNASKFFAAARKSVFGGRMSQAQVDGTQAILDSMQRNGITNPHHAAQILAHVRRETGGYMLPVKETVHPSSKDKNPSDATVIKRLDAAWAKGQLKGVKSPYWRDGAFGRGAIQLSHWANYDKFAKKLGVPLRQNPSLALAKDISADIAVIGMRDGMFRSRKLSNYDYPSSLFTVPAQHPRRIVNGVDGSDSEITKDHISFHTALVEGGWGDVPKPATKPVVKPVPKPISKEDRVHSGMVSDVVMSVQEKLDQLGYPEVGAFDGRWGNRTKAAVLAFRSDSDLPLKPVIDDTLLSALMTASPRKEASSRSHTTVKDLREIGAEDIKQADQTQIGGIALAGTGAVAAAGEGLDQLGKHSESLSQVAAFIDPLKSFIQDNFWLLLIGGGAFFIWKSGILKRIRLEKHRSGQDVSE